MCILFGYFKKHLNEFEIKQLPPFPSERLEKVIQGSIQKCLNKKNFKQSISRKEKYFILSVACNKNSLIKIGR